MKTILWLSILLISISFSKSHAADSEAGKNLFETKGCIGCHTIGNAGETSAGPDLAGVTKIRKISWLRRWIKDPDKMRNDPIIQQYKSKYPLPMPSSGLTDKEVDDIIAYLAKFPRPADQSKSEGNSDPKMHGMAKGGMPHRTPREANKK